MLKHGVSIPWASPMVLVKITGWFPVSQHGIPMVKWHDDRMRTLCTLSQPVNQLIELIDRLGQAKVITLDLSKGY